MFERELMIQGLRRQENLLSDLIDQLERKPMLDFYDRGMYEERTGQIAKNLRKLRQIKKTYLTDCN